MLTKLNLVRLCATIVLATLAVALAGAQSARAISVPVLIDTVTVGDGVAVVTGTVDADLVEVNGQAVVIGDDGAFRAEVDVDVDAFVLDLLGSENEAVSIRIPIQVLLSTGGDGVLDGLLDAGISIDVPSGGFQVVDGERPVVEGRVLDGSTLEKLEVNGRDVLGELGDNGLFSVNLGSSPSSSTRRETVTIVATDHRGVSQTSTFKATSVKSTIGTRAGTSVSAAGARGIVISRIAFDKRFLGTAKHVRVLVTVKDRRGYLIRGALLRLRALPAKHVANGAVRAGFTNRIGKAQFGYRLRQSAFTGTSTKVMTFAARAATPKASTTKRFVLRLPAAVTR